MRVGHNDVSGQRGEEYMLVPLVARNHSPAFWEWPHAFAAPTHYDERLVRVIDDGTLTTSRIYYVDERSEFRLVTNLYAAGPAAASSLLEVTKDPRPGVDYEYRLHVPGSPRHALLLPHATHDIRNSDKVWGYF
jgi:hypothetical protein